jgi:DNA segregation ATPase FtsK/SpoIIIE-like protein
MTELLQHGASVGIHLILGTQEPETTVFDTLMRANLPVRLVGQVHNEQQAHAAAGILNTQAEYLLGKGDFLAIVGGETTHFQSAYIGDYDLHLCLEDLHRNRPQPLLAQPISVRPAFLPGANGQEPHLPQLFSFDGQEIALEDE